MSIVTNFTFEFVVAFFDGNKAIADFVLQNVNSSSPYLTLRETFTEVSGQEYRIEVDGIAAKGGYAEPISKTATATCP